MEENKTKMASSLSQPVSTMTKNIVAILWFIIIFGILLLVASLVDLDLSIRLTKGSLRAGEYFSTSQFGLFFEAMGSAPIWILGAIASTIFFWNAVRLSNKGARITLGILLALVTGVVLYFFFADIFKYVLEKVDAKDYANQTYIVLLKVLLASSMAAMLILLWKNVKPETTEILLKWAVVIVCVAACYLLITILKSPMGRVRFRAINYTDDWTFYSDWWEINGARKIYGLPADACKSFPSGHTFSAGVIYTIICLPNLLPSWNKKWLKSILWIFAIAYTGTVALSRIIVGAHFLSDVLFGGTIAFLATILFREIIIEKFKRFRKTSLKQSIDDYGNYE